MIALVPIAPADTQSQQLNRAITACLTNCAPTTRRVYSACIARFVRWCSDYTAEHAFAREAGAGLTREHVAAWLDSETAGGASAVASNQALSAVKRLAHEAASLGWLPWETSVQIAGLKSRKYRGVRSGRWLTIGQVRQLMSLPDRQTVRGRRDAAVLALLIGCGLRREEACGLTVDQLAQYPDGWRLVNLVGKGNRVRTVSAPSWVVREVQGWLTLAGVTDGKILRRVGQ